MTSSAADPRSAQRSVIEPEVIALEDVSVVREGRRLLNGVDWTVHRHERWVVLGPNGAGKTTLLQVASSYLGPTTGTVRLLGEAYGSVNVRDLRERIGYAGAAVASLVRENLPAREIVVTGIRASFVAARFHDYDEADWQCASGQLQRMAAGHLAARRFSTLSTGERQRVLIARSMMTNPEVLLLDEATTGLDLGAREQLMASLSNMAMDRTSPATVLVTHHVEEIPPGFGSVVLMSAGRPIAVGAIDDVLSSESLSECFEADLQLERRGGRYRAWMPQQRS